MIPVYRTIRGRSLKRQGWLAFLACLVFPSGARSEIPAAVDAFAKTYCTECHGSESQKGDFRIDTLPWSFSDTGTREQWELVFDYISDGDMPPEKARHHPDAGAKKSFLNQLETVFAKADESAKPGGTPLRRLNRVEYLNTVRDLFGIRMIKLPLAFPADATNTEFDTMPEGLFLSPAVMEAYHETAANIADRIAPLPGPPVYKSNYAATEIGADGVRVWYGPKKQFVKFTGFNNSGWSGAVWDSLFVAPASGVYRVRLLANAQAQAGADGKPLRLGFYVFDPTEESLPKRYRRDRATRVAEFDMPAGKPTWMECDVAVEAGETFHVYCENRFSDGKFPMGALNRTRINQEVKRAKAENAPTVELRGMEVEGPVAIPPRVKAFFGSYPPKLNRAELELRLLPLAASAFRRPLTGDEKKRLISSVLSHGANAEQPEFAWHFAIRRILCSPAFLYRESEPEPTALASDRPASPKASGYSSLNQFALASRLSYFLWSTMPDDELMQLAEAGRLSDPKVLQQQTRRLLKDPKSQQFVKHFTGQWLGNRAVTAINICDNRYQWDDNVRYGFVRSTEMFFEEVLRKNLPIATFVDSDFTYANIAMKAVWGMKGAGKLESIAASQRQSLVWAEPERISLNDPPQGMPDHVLRRRGVLGLAGVLTVTGDGVESSPILRGVWVLENLFGQHPPPPPSDVPALDVDTSKATSVREILAAHQKIETCAKCHRDIDPFGLALENFDAVGGFRNNYIGQKEPIDATATMPDGTQLDGAESIRKVLLAKPEIFTRCLLVKLLQYGAGRELSVGDQRVVDAIVQTAPDDGFRFQDLIVAATASEVFRTK